MIRNIIFDFDGTLADTSPLIIKTMQTSIKALGLPSKSDDECRASIGLRLEDIPTALWPDRPGLTAEFAKTYRRIFEELKGANRVSCYPGVTETLRLFHEEGYHLAIASSRSHKSLEEYVAEFGFGGYFSAVIGGNDVEHGKPAPDPVLAITGPCGWDVAETLVVGDATFDILMGRNAGAITCGVSYGNQSREQLAEAMPDAIIPAFPALIPIVKGVTPSLVEYVEEFIIPSYSSFDKAHREDHVRTVIYQSLRLADTMPELTKDMVYAVAAFHDTGLVNGREHHHTDSALILSSDSFIRSHFTADEIRAMAEAIEDHRASGKSKPRNDYGLVVAEADRIIHPETIVRRTIQYGLSNYPELDEEGQFMRTLAHLEEKYGPDGYLKIWFPESENALRLRQLHSLIADRERLRDLFKKIYTEESGK